MGFFDSIDGNVNDIMGNLNYLKKKIVKESAEIKKTAKIKYEILNEERYLSELFEKLGRHEYKLIKGEISNLNVESALEEIERHKARISSLKMGLDLSENLNNIDFVNEKKDEKDFSGLYVDKSESEESDGSIIFIKEDEDEGK
ncbi:MULTISPECIES: hypothetical protein [Peptoniphilus]|uniref:hypothetical protein n=1 Tax=Peptoniphilus TaxID=162289 RepID=UPI000288E14D|nr:MULTISPECIES: hypothetical protein [Peptoniphilus]MBS6610721.1 hypothetical protein [Peptoniphilus harei]MDU1042922.1 hypothetical protein [Peptoniphilus rhinitidis]MDU1954366.1 hypothetical protein [Peptoniphilus lacydonensis]MDU2109197.1 hypothetical protein [Peptoniphilus lacydonensis]MDU2115095.1 hypothetical protein [Peptoniphilus lacydonensis]